MKVDVIDVLGKKTSTVALPEQFVCDVRPDLISRILRALFSNRRQAYGAQPGAGMRASAKLSRRRGAYKGAYKKGISRSSRKTMSRRGSQFNWVGAVSPGSVGGRRAHPPKSSTSRLQKVNRKERQYALRSALATAAVQQRVCVVSGVEQLSKGKDVSALLSACHIQLPGRQIRAGRGVLRGRKYKEGVGPLFVVASSCPLLRSARNLSGASVVSVRSLHAGHVMKDSSVPRHLVWSPEALSVLSKEKLYL